MGLKPIFTDADVQRALQRGAAQIHDGILKIFQYVGEDFVKDARSGLNISGAFDKGDYKDRTANLRSSIGYFVMKDGIVIHNNIDGTMRGMMLAQETAVKVSKGEGYELIGVAGMDYASAVESLGYNVITSQSDVALVDLQRLVKNFVSRMNNRGLSGYEVIGNLVTTAMR